MQDTNLKSGPYRQFIEHVGLRNPRLADLVALLINTSDNSNFNPENVFQPRMHQGFDLLQVHAKAIVNNLKTYAWPIIDSHLRSTSYLPIRVLRGSATSVWGDVDKLRIFLSSGTTSGPEGRSKSAYSPAGLELYQAGSIAAFLGVLEKCVLPFSGEFLNMVSVSLIPRVDEWPDSSLAQMIAWFSDYWPTSYAPSDSVAETLIALKNSSSHGKPIVLFGTAFHFVNLVDQGFSFKLPEGSIIVETGGTKGRSRAISREELYQALSKRFGIAESSIVSEYGMCELASQAWDFVDSGKTLTLAERSFKFPWWVTPGLMTSPSRALSAGVGALVIDDPLRIDIGECALQTEDMAELNKNGSFKLLGRVPRAPLKGCSLKVADIAETSILGKSTSSGNPSFMIHPDEPGISQRAPVVRKWFLDLLADPEAQSRLTLELGDKSIALSAIEDLAFGVPESPEGFIKAAGQAIDGKPVPKNWLLIAPSSHSIAGIHPLAAAMTLGLDLRVRLPEINGLAFSRTFLARAIEMAETAGLSVKALPPTFRVGKDDLLDGEYILIFGDNETCAAMESFAPGRVAAFGTIISLSTLRAGDFGNNSQIRGIIADQLSLAQRGCLSSRIILVFGGDADDVRKTIVEASTRDFYSPPLTPGILAARAIEEVRLSQAGFSVNQSRVMVATKNSTLSTLGLDLNDGLSRLDYVIPILVLPNDCDESSAIKVASQTVPLRAISAGAQSLAALLNSKNWDKFRQNILLVGAGMLGRQPFDGRHLGRSFFGVRR